MDSDYLFHRLENPADAVSPYPSFYEGPRLDFDSSSSANRDGRDRRPGERCRELYDDDCTLWVGNIDLRITETMIFELFSQVGDIGDISFPKHFQDGEKSVGFCFVNFMVPDSVPRAIEVMQGTVLFGRKLFLKCRPDSIHAIRAQPFPRQTSTVRGTKRIVLLESNPKPKFKSEGQRENEFPSKPWPHSSTRRMEERTWSSGEENVQTSKYSPIRAPTPDKEGARYSNRFNRMKSLKEFQQERSGNLGSDHVRDNQRRRVVFRSSSGSVLPVVNIKTFPQPKISSVVITPPAKPTTSNLEASSLASSISSTPSPSHGTSLSSPLSSPHKEKSEGGLREKVASTVTPIRTSAKKHRKSADISEDNESPEEKAEPQQIQIISTVSCGTKTKPSTSTPSSYFNQNECHGFSPLYLPDPPSTYINSSQRQGLPYSNQRYHSQGIPSSLPAPHLNQHFRPPAPNSYFNRYQYPPSHPNCWRPHGNYNGVQSSIPTAPRSPRYAYFNAEHYGTPLYNVCTSQSSYEPNPQPTEIQSTVDPSYTAPSYSHLSPHHQPSSNYYKRLTPDIRRQFSSRNRSPLRRYTPSDKFSRIGRSRSSSRNSSKINYPRCRSSSRESDYSRYSSRSSPSRRRSSYSDDIYNQERSSSTCRRSRSRTHSLSYNLGGQSSSKNYPPSSPDREPDATNKKRSSSTSATSSSTSTSSDDSEPCHTALDLDTTSSSQKSNSTLKFKSKTRGISDTGNSRGKSNSSRSYDTEKEYDPSDPGFVITDSL